MTWINTISFAEATGRLKSIYQRVKGADDKVDNILMAHSLRPHTLEGHMTLYKNVLHHSGNSLPKWFLETIGTYVSLLNQCQYCVNHHFDGLKRLLNDDEHSEKIFLALQNSRLEDIFDSKQCAMLNYSKSLTLEAASISQETIHTLREVGYSDGEILEANQVTAYFNYANRTVLGLGVNTEGDVLGTSPSDNSDDSNWSHS
jgi:uncharacterized peroxidase-related enzyme